MISRVVVSPKEEKISLNKTFEMINQLKKDLNQLDLDKKKQMRLIIGLDDESNEFAQS